MVSTAILINDKYDKTCKTSTCRSFIKISTCRSFTLFNSWWKHLREDVNKSFKKNAQ